MTLTIIGVVYILPILGNLSRRLKKGSLSFARIVPAIKKLTKDRLHHLVADTKLIGCLGQDIESFTVKFAEIKNKKN